MIVYVKRKSGNLYEMREETIPIPEDSVKREAGINNRQGYIDRSEELLTKKRLKYFREKLKEEKEKLRKYIDIDCRAAANRILSEANGEEIIVVTDETYLQRRNGENFLLSLEEMYHKVLIGYIETKSQLEKTECVVMSEPVWQQAQSA